MIDDELLKTQDVCKMLNVHRVTLLNSFVKTGLIKRYKYGKSNRYKRSEVLAYIQQTKEGK